MLFKYIDFNDIRKMTFQMTFGCLFNLSMGISSRIEMTYIPVSIGMSFQQSWILFWWMSFQYGRLMGNTQEFVISIPLAYINTKNRL